MKITQILANDNYIIVNKELIKMYGLEEAILIGELCSEYEYWFKKEIVEDGYFYSTIENVEERTTLSAFKQRKILKKLKDEFGILDYTLKGIPAKRYIKLNEEKILEQMTNFNSKMLKNLTTGCENIKQQYAKKFNTKNNKKNNKKNNATAVKQDVKKLTTDETEIIKFYEENIGTLTPFIAEELLEYLRTMNIELIQEAIKIATRNNIRSWSYIRGILKSWDNKGFKVIADIEQERKQDTKGLNSEWDAEEEARRIFGDDYERISDRDKKT